MAIKEATKDTQATPIVTGNKPVLPKLNITVTGKVQKPVKDHHYGLSGKAMVDSVNKVTGDQLIAAINEVHTALHGGRETSSVTIKRALRAYYLTLVQEAEAKGITFA